MEKILFFITTLFATFKIETMNRNEINKLKAAAFDSFDEDDNYDDEDNYDDNYDDEFKGKKKAKARPVAKQMKASNGYFTIKIVNGTGSAQNVQLFDSFRNAIYQEDTTLYPTYAPFTAVNRSAANLNSVIYFNAKGDQVIQTAAGTFITITCQQVPYRQLLKNLEFFRISVKTLKMTYTNESQLDNDLFLTENTFLGKSNRNTITPRTSFADNQFQSKQVTINQPFMIDGERGMYFSMNSGETITFAFNLDGVSKF